jgi:hypothetical protein
VGVEGRSPVSIFSGAMECGTQTVIYGGGPCAGGCCGAADTVTARPKASTGANTLRTIYRSLIQTMDVAGGGAGLGAGGATTAAGDAVVPRAGGGGGGGSGTYGGAGGFRL